ncbi:MAG: hypothetical protein ACI9HI_002490, partial [Salinirussus sp.]
GMETVPDLVAAGRDRDGVALSVPGRTTDYRYDDVCTNVWKSGNLLRHYGLRAGATATVAVGPKEPDEGQEALGWLDSVDPLLGLLGAAQVGATVDLDPAPDAAVEGRVFVLPDGWVDRYEAAPGTSRVAYGGPPADSGVTHFERERWSENPMQPPDPPAAADDLLAGYTHGDLVGAAQRVADEHGLGETDRVALGAPLAGSGRSVAGTLAAGVLAPMLAGAAVVATGPAVGVDAENVAASLVVGGSGDIEPETVL